MVPTLRTDPETIEPYLRDESGYAGHADAVALPRDVGEIAALLRRATTEATPVTFSARRTSLTGAAVPEGGLVVAVPALEGPEHVHIDPAALRATAPAGLRFSDLGEAAEAAGAFFPPDPTSRRTCSVGGAVVCNASGARSFRFGPVGAFVEGLRVVLATGEILELRRGENPPRDGAYELDLDRGRVRVPCPPRRRAGVKSALGYASCPEPGTPDLIDLFIGSEGTLGYVDEVTVRLLPAVEIFAALAFFPTEAAAVDLVERLQSAPPPGVEPMSLEWFDRRSLELAAERHPRLGVPSEAAAALFVEQAAPPGGADAAAEAWYAALVSSGVPDADAWLRLPRGRAQLEAFRDFRHAVPDSINALIRQRGLRKLGTDLAWPRGSLRRMLARYAEVLADVPAALGPGVAAEHQARWGRPLPATLDHATFGHVGDDHLHMNLLPRDAAEGDAGWQVYLRLARECAAAGGAISGEHGVGKTRRDLLAEVLPPEALAVMKAIKAALDPARILGRGNVLAA